MAESLVLPQNATKAEKYTALIPQIAALTQGEPDLIANIANVAAALKQAFDFFWVGFYIVRGENLVLGPFQGPIACTRIGRGKGVCGTAWEEKKIVLVPDVNLFPGHIACSSDSKSEIVLPALKENEVVLILDIDSNKINDFDEVDRDHLTEIMKLIERIL